MVPPAQKSPEETLKSSIDEGLRARLETASLVTGQQVVQLNFFPGTIKLEQTDLPHLQIPTVPSPTQQIMSSVDAAAKDLPTLIKEATVQQILSPENEAAIHSILESAASAMKSLRADAASLSQLIDGADNTLASAGQLSKHLDGFVQDDREDIRATVRNFRSDSDREQADRSVEPDRRDQPPANSTIHGRYFAGFDGADYRCADHGQQGDGGP